MAQLPLANPELPSKKQFRWEVRHGALAASLLAALLFGGVSAYFRFSEPAKPAPFDPESWVRESSRQIDQWTPSKGFLEWASRYRNETQQGFSELRNRQAEKDLKKIELYRGYETTFLWLAAVAIVIGIVASLSGGRSSPGGRP